MQKLSNLLLLHLILFQELSPQMTKCFKDVFSHILILTVIDQAKTTSKFQSTVPIEQELHPILEMELQLPMETMDQHQIMSLTHYLDQKKILNFLGKKVTFQDKLVDILTLILILISNNLVVSGKKYSPKLIVNI